MNHLRYSFAMLSIVLLFSCCRTDPEEQKQTTKPKQEQKESSNPELDRLDEQIAENNQDAGLYFRRGTLYEGLNKTHLAIEDYKRAAKLAPEEDTYNIALAEGYLKAREVREAIDLLEAAVKRKESVRLRLQLAKYYHIVQRYKDSLHHISVALQTDQTNPTAYYISGMVLKESGDTASAIKSFELATTHDSDHYDAYMQLGLLGSATNNKYTDKYFDNAFRINQFSTEALYGKGMYWQQQGDYEEAEAVYKKILEIDAQFEKSYYNMGYMLWDREKYKEAWKNFDITTRLAPSYADAYYMRGLCSEALGDVGKAKKDYEQALVFEREHELAKKALEHL